MKRISYLLQTAAAMLILATTSTATAQTLNVYSKGTATNIKAADIRSIKFDKKLTISSPTSSAAWTFEFNAVDSMTVSAAQTASYKGSITKGLADSVWTSAIVTSCTGMFTLGRSGRIKDASGTSWIVPMEVNAGRAIPDLFTPCTGSMSTADTSKLETIVIDPDGVVITAYLHADNYFELYVNGVFIGRDPIPFTPFNSNIVRFKVKYPITYAIKCADWEEHLGVGMEYDTYNVGDAGFIAYFSDGTKTDETWKSQVFYIAPLDDPSCVVETADGVRNSLNCSKKPACSSNKNPSGCYALHYPIPDGWSLKTFDDSKWPSASIFTEAQFGPKEAYTNYRSLFRDAKFIWSSNLDLDNFVILRKTVTK